MRLEGEGEGGWRGATHENWLAWVAERVLDVLGDRARNIVRTAFHAQPVLVGGRRRGRGMGGRHGEWKGTVVVELRVFRGGGKRVGQRGAGGEGHEARARRREKGAVICRKVGRVGMEHVLGETKDVRVAMSARMRHLARKPAGVVRGVARSRGRPGRAKINKSSFMICRGYCKWDE